MTLTKIPRGLPLVRFDLSQFQTTLQHRGTHLLFHTEYLSHSSLFFRHTRPLGITTHITDRPIIPRCNECVMIECAFFDRVRFFYLGLTFCRDTWLISIGDVMLSVLFFPGLFKCFCVLAIFDLTTKPCQLTIYICSFILTSKQIMHSNKSSFLHNTEYQAASKWDPTTIPTSNGGNLTLFISSIQTVLLSRIP